MLKVAMIGAGGYAYELIKRIWMLPDKYELVAVSSSPDRKSVGKTDCLQRGVEVYPDAETLIEAMKDRVKVIFVPTPIHTHKLLAKKCIDAGFDVFLEKPPVATVQELDELDNYACDHGRRTAVMFQSLYTSIMTDLKNRIVGDELGKVRRVKGVAAWPRHDDYFARSSWAGKIKVNDDWVLDGTINNPLAHLLSNQLYLASPHAKKMAEPVEVAAELYHGHNIQSEDTSSLRIITKDGVEILFNTSLCPDGIIESLITVECEKGTIEFQNFNKASITYSNGRKETIHDESEQRVYMLTELYESYMNDTNFACDLKTCRPFTVSVNAAFESCGAVNHIDGEHIVRSEQSGTIKTVIKDIDNILAAANTEGKLFSEMAVKWAKPSRTLNYDSISNLNLELNYKV